MKTCTLCGERKNIVEFYDHPNTSDGLQSQCKTCVIISKKVRIKAYKRVALDRPVESADACASVTVSGVL